MEQEKNTNIEKENQPKKDYVRIVLKAILYLILGIFVLNSLLYIVLSIPFVQNKLIHFASDTLSTMLKTEVSVSEVRFNLFNKVSLKDLYVEDQSKDTLVYAHRIGASIEPIRFILQSKIKLGEVKLDDFFINITAQDSLSSYNFQFIVDEFSSTDSTSVDSTSAPLDLTIDEVKLTKGRFAYRIKNDSITPELFNPSDIYVTDLNANVSIHSIDMNKLDIHVNSISAKEKSDFEITKLQGHIVSDSSLIKIEELLLTLPNSHLTAKSLFYDLKTEDFEVITEDTKIDPRDITPFYENLKYLDQALTLETSISGKLPAIDAKKILIAYGNDAILEGNAFITSYLSLNDANFGVNVDRLMLSPHSIKSFSKLGDETLELPDILDSIGNITLDAKLNGRLSDFNLESNGSMKLGSLRLTANGNIDTTFTRFDVTSNLIVEQFDLVPFIGTGMDIGHLSMHVNVEAQQRGVGTLTAKAKGMIDSLQLHHGAVESFPFAASYSPDRIGFGADAKLHFGRIMAGFEMKNYTTKPDINLGLRITDFDIAHFYENKYWQHPSLNFDVKGEIKQFDIDNLKANITIKDLKFTDHDFNYEPGPIDIKAWEDTLKSTKHISLTSSILSANIDGNYKFSTLSEELSELMHRYLSNVFPTSKKKIEPENNFTFNFKVFNSEELGYIFDLPADIVEPLEIDGIINAKDYTIDVVGQLPLVKTSSLEIKDSRLNIANMDSTFNIKLDSDIKASDGTYSVGLELEGIDNIVFSELLIDTDPKGVKIRGGINAVADFKLDENNKLVSLFEIIPNNVQVGEFWMNFLPARIINTEGRTHIENLGIGINDQKYLDINGYVSKNKEDSLFVTFSKAQIAEVLQGLNINNIYGEIDGTIIAMDVLDAPALHIEDFKINDIIVYNDTLGTIGIDTYYNQEYGSVLLMARLDKNDRDVMFMQGIISPEDQNINLHMDIERFSVDWLKPFTEGLLSDISGDISSHVTIKGTFDEPVAEGFLGFNNTKIGIDYTNVDYYIADTIEISPERIGFDNLILRDGEGNRGIVNARVTHRNFKNMKYHLDMKTQNLLVLNTQSRTDSLFYGKLFASGSVNIEGSDEGIDLNMQLKNGKKSRLNITVPQVAEASEYKSVVYINVPKEKLPIEDLRWKREQKKQGQDIPIRLKMKLNVDPELALGVIIDPDTGDQMNARGSGTIDFSYDMRTQNMSAFGNYNVSDGNVRLNLQNISKLEFKIRPGSKLNFIGDPLKTKFDITAYRRVRADLRTLSQSFDFLDASPRVQVDCLLKISGDINKMDLGYDIELVGASDQQVRDARVLINTDEMRIRQFAYLIASGTFYSNTSSSGANFSDGMWTNLASSALSGGLNSLFGSILGDNWELGADLTDGDTSVSATTRLLDNRLKLHANVGHRSESSRASTSPFVGDFDAEYTLNSTWTVKAYSHTNDSYYRQAPTTQGVGIVYTREGPTFKRMFRSIGRRRGAWARIERDSLQALQRDSIRLDSIRIANKRDSINHIIHKDHPHSPTESSINGADSTTNRVQTNHEEINKYPARREEEDK